MRIKKIYLIIACLLFNNALLAQNTKRDTVVYYLKKSGRAVVSKDSADYFMVILPPDSNVDRNLFTVNQYYRTGKPKLVGQSKTNNLALKYEGRLMEYFPSGRKMRIANFLNGQLSGDMVEYYPNGKFYNSKNIIPGKKPYLMECSDSLGNALAVKGYGKWIEFAPDFKTVKLEGKISKGLQQGEWIGTLDAKNHYWIFKDGALLSSGTFTAVNGAYGLSHPLPEYPGGPASLRKFLMDSVRYPNQARRFNIGGRVVVTFTVEKNGDLTGIKVAKGIAYGCDEEALRLIANSAPWIPATEKGIPKLVTYSVPVEFNLVNKGIWIPPAVLNDTTNTIFTQVDKVPEFPGGTDMFSTFILQNMRYPLDAYKRGLEGTIILGFVVEKNGELTNIRIDSGIGGGCDEEALRVLSLSPSWNPGMQAGRPVRVAYSVPISFSLSNK